MIPVIPMRLAEGALPPVFSSSGAAGADLCANLPPGVAYLKIPSGECCLVPTGVFLEIPEDYEGQIRPRSGLAAKHRITVLNSPGTIDSDYRGEIKVLLINHDPREAFYVAQGSRIAQLVIAPVTQAHFQEVAELSTTKRADGGFGSTGV